MWAAFGYTESIPPLAFAIPAMFAKSSTIYNPVIYLMLRPNFRKEMCRDLGIFCHTCLKGHICSQGSGKFRSKSTIRVSLCNIHRQMNQTSSFSCSAQPPVVASKAHSCKKCKDAFECFRQYPQECHVTNTATNVDTSGDQAAPGSQTNKKTHRTCHKKSLLATTCPKRMSEIDSLQINLEMVPRHTKLAWP
ncbi:hypothetical protein LDENG_00268310 [Lucifuga dentata]|nr:hypothetical protein LDENG_00268310 [Lucifuga dentata]